MFPFKRLRQSPPPQGCWLGDQVVVWLGNAPLDVPSTETVVDSARGFQLLRFRDAATRARCETALAPRVMPGPDLRLAANPRLDRARLLEFCGQSLGWDLAPHARSQLGNALRELRELLRPHRPAVIAGDLPLVCIDTLLRAGADEFFVRGWWRCARGQPENLTIVTPEGMRVDVLPDLHAMPRTDLAARFPGDSFTSFRATFRTPHPSWLDQGWLAEFATSDGIDVECSLPAAVSDSVAALDAILSDIGLEWEPSGTGVAAHLDRFVQRLLRERLAGAGIAREFDYGSAPESPPVSVLVPIYRRLDFVEAQFVQFARDPESRQFELLYLLDSPELETALRARLADCTELYGVPARLLVANRNCGYATINNLGARRARAPLLVFLNSDAIPFRPGWVGELAAFHRRTRQIGALGPKLVFEDGSLQHAGESFRRHPARPLWEIVPHYKGLHAAFPAANLARSIPAVTGACLMVARDLFDQVGGFDPGFVQGDFEDSDLCLSLLAAGRVNWYLPSVELYHVEGASYSSAERARNFIYNQWRHSTRWDATLQLLAQSSPEASRCSVA